MGRVLAFDYGTKRVGIAVSDPLKLIANTLETSLTKNIFQFIDNYCLQEEVDEFVVGYPFAHGHQQNPVAQEIELFIAKLQKKYPQKTIHRIDESFTSKIAAQTLLNSGVNKKERRNKGYIDAIAANLILQTFLEMQQRK